MKMISYQYSFPKLNYYNKTVKKRWIVLKANENHHENYQVFQHRDTVYNDNVNIKDVEDHLEAVHKLSKTDKDDYFMSQGLDYDRCYEYINIVKYLNRCWKTKHNPIENTKLLDNTKLNPFIIPGWTILVVIAFIYYSVKDKL